MSSSDWLSGIRVVCVGQGPAGEFATSLLSDLGAAVTSVPLWDATASVLSASSPPWPYRTRSVFSVLATRASRDGGDVDATKAISEADIVVADTMGRPLRTHEMIDSYLREVERSNRSAWISLSGFGLTGPRRTHQSSDLVCAAAGGLVASFHDPAGNPRQPPRNLAVSGVGLVAALAAVHTLDLVRREHGPVHTEVSAQEAVMAWASLPELAHVLLGCVGASSGARYSAPSGLFRCRDGYIRITAIDDHQWQGVVTVMGSPSWSDAIKDVTDRRDNADKINEEVTRFVRDWDREELSDLLQANGVPATALNSPDEFLRSRYAKVRPPQRVHVDDTVLDVPANPIALASSRPPSTSELPARGLQRLKVLELTHYLAAPIAGSLLGAMGASVLRLEESGRLDLYRRAGPFADGIAGPERGAYFAAANYSKGSVVDASAEELAELVARADVLIKNVSPSKAASLRLANDELAPQRPDMLIVDLSGFGRTGPLARFRAFAANIHVYCGLINVQDGDVIATSAVLADPLSSYMCALAVAAWAVGSPQGDALDMSMADVVAFEMRDRFVAVAAAAEVADDAVWADVLAQDEDGRWVAVSARSEDELHAAVRILAGAELDRITGEHDKAECIAMLRELIGAESGSAACGQLQLAGIPAYPVVTADVLISDAHLQARGFFVDVDHDVLGHRRMVGLPWRVVGREPFSISAPPLLGRHQPWMEPREAVDASRVGQSIGSNSGVRRGT